MGTICQAFIRFRKRPFLFDGFLRTSKGHEVNFLVTPPHGEPLLIQVAAELNDPPTRKRKLQVVTEAMEELKIKKSLVITMSREERLEAPIGQIHICPAWFWAVSGHETR